MNMKFVAVGVVVILAAAGAGAAVLLMKSDKADEDTILTHRLLVMGNVCSDDTLDSNDVTVLEALVEGKETTIHVAGNDIDLTDANLKKYADVNQDKSVDSNDVDALKKIINNEASVLYYENAKGAITSVKVPINNLLVMFRRVGTTVAMVGASDMVKGFISDLGPSGNYGFLGFTGEIVQSGSEPNFEKIKEMNKTFESTGGVTLIADATGSAANLEEGCGPGIDVVRMPVTEMGKSENGVVTLGYLLAYKNAKHDQIHDKLNTWIEWNDGAKKKIEDAVKKLSDSDKKTCIVGMYNASASTATINVRGSGVSEYEYSVMCGGNNIGANGSYTESEFSEFLLAKNPEYAFVMQQEVFLLKNKIPATQTYNDLKETISSNYHGKIGMFSQFFGTGPGYVLSLMYYASVLIPELKDTFDITKEYKYFMGTIVGNEELANIPAFVPITE